MASQRCVSSYLRSHAHGSALPQTSPDVLAAFCRRHHVRRLALYGSALRGELRPESDLDLLVEFEEGHTPGFLRLAAMEAELSDRLGRPVDLRTPEDLSPYFRDEVTAAAAVQYVAEG